MGIYMLRAPLSLAKMSYDAATGAVIYRSKMRPGLKRNSQVMPGAEGLALLCKHIPDRYEHRGALHGVVIEPGTGRAREASLAASCCYSTLAPDALTTLPQRS